MSIRTIESLGPQKSGEQRLDSILTDQLIGDILSAHRMIDATRDFQSLLPRSIQEGGYALFHKKMKRLYVLPGAYGHSKIHSALLKSNPMIRLLDIQSDNRGEKP